MIDLVIDQRRRDLGGFEVGRVLPFAQRRMVGPFVFFDHIGPVEFPAGIPSSFDVRPHPHIGLSTVTYLFEGEIVHRDSVGSEQPICPGEVNWMVAGSGITHSERFERARREGGRMHGIQAWVVSGPPSTDALIRVRRLTAPTFSDVSEGVFAITADPLAVLTPRGGEQWVVGTQKNITWGGLGLGTVDIELSRDGGLSWTTLYAATPNDGTQAWAVTGPPTADALVRITDTEDPAATDVSDAPFALIPGTLALSAPNGGERLAIGSLQPILWQTSTGGSVRLTWNREDSALELQVIDDGPGIADTANLFVPFFTTKPEGSGIGLALCRQIAEAHGGSVALENRSGTRGCVARVRLPLH